MGLPEAGFSFFGPNGSDIFFCMSAALCMIWNWLGSCGCNSFEAYDTSSTWLTLWLKEAQRLTHVAQAYSFRRFNKTLTKDLRRLRVVKAPLSNS